MIIPRVGGCDCDIRRMQIDNRIGTDRQAIKQRCVIDARGEIDKKAAHRRRRRHHRSDLIAIGRQCKPFAGDERESALG